MGSTEVEEGKRKATLIMLPSFQPCRPQLAESELHVSWQALKDCLHSAVVMFCLLHVYL